MSMASVYEELLQTEIEELRQQLAERDKRVMMLRDKLAYADLILEKDYNHIVPSIKRTIAATEPKP